jgi:purine-binding chemotaxis protein CheW
LTTSVSIETTADETPADSTALRLLVFAVGGTVYGCDIASVREIVALRPTTRLPGSPPFVSGLVNLRGAIVTVIDLGTRLGNGAASAEGSVVLAECGSRVIGLAVDDVRDVQAIPRDLLDDGAGDLGRGGIVRGLGHLDAGVVIVLDVETLVHQVLA